MMHCRYIFLLLSFCSSVGQLVAQDTLKDYYNKYWVKTDNPEHAYYYRIKFLSNGLWEVNNYYAKNNRVAEAYTCLIVDSIRQGHYVKYYKNGYKEREGEYVANFQVGQWTSWFESGKKSAEEIFISDTSVIRGVLQKDSVLIFTLKNARFGYDGIRQRECNWYYENGMVSAREIYKEGRIEKAELWDEDGKKILAEIKDVYENTQRPQFEGNLSAFIAQNVRYPKDAREAGIEGREVIKFAVDEDGSIDECEVLKSLGSKSIDIESLRVVRLMNGKFKPGIAHNRKAKFYYTLPISFRVQK